jgi:starch synthase (maltosyl-transferring)
MNASDSGTAPHLYDLFPRLAGTMDAWPAHAARAAAMGFDWLYLNPVHYPGFSGSCYAVKDFYRVDPLLLPAGHPDKHYDDALRGDGGLAALGAALSAVRAQGLRPVMDLVLNHTARDSRLVQQHPEWYARDAGGEILSPSAIDPADARRVTVWGDLAEIDNAASPAREELWAFWEGIVTTYARLGFEGFRCDAAYKVPAALWRRLIAAAERERPGARFFGETLGARLEEVEALHESGLHFVFNSSKWWAFDAPWCLEQQGMLPPGRRSVSFPESHDTPRLWAETGGRRAVQQQRYAFAAAFASGLLMPVGYEYGFERRIDVVTTRATDWEPARIDLTAFVRRVHAMRRAHPVLACEANAALGPLDRPVLVLEKRSESGAVAHVAINKDWQAPQMLHAPARGRRVLRPCRDDAPADESSGDWLELAPAEVAYLV